MKYDTQAVSGQEGSRFHHAARSGLGRILAAGWLTHGGMDGWRNPNHYVAALVIKGSGVYQDHAGMEVPVVEGGLILGFPGLRHYYRPLPGTVWTEFYLVFEGPVFALWEQCGLLTRDMPVIQIRSADHWARRFESVLGASGRPGTDPAMIEVCRLQSVLADLLWQGRGRAADQEELEWVLKARAVLESEAHRHLPVTEMAGRFSMSAHAFRKKFARLVGESPARYRSARIIDRACELMQTTSLLDKQIAERLGFCDEFYFSRRFREVTGKSPREFRAILPQGRV